MTRRWLSLVAAGVVMLIGTVAVSRDSGTFAAWTHLTMTISVAGGFLVLWTAWSWREQRPGRRWLTAVLLLGVILRVITASSTRELSDDAARYHWDGKAVVHGFNPYQYAPDEATVGHLRIHDIDERINHPWNRTCYPPVAQALFAAGYLLSPGRLAGLQLLGLLGEIAAWILLARELSRRRRSWSWLLLAAWSPLLVFQGYLPGHVDVFNVPFVTLLILSVTAGQSRRAGLYLALCCLVKPLPLLWLPAMAKALGWRKTMELSVVFAVVMTAAYIPFHSAGWKLFSSTWLMATDWSFNGSFGAMFEAVLPLQTAHMLSGALVVVLVVAIAWRTQDFLTSALMAQVVFTSLTPTLFTWHLIGAYPLLVLSPQPGLLTLGVLAPLSDEVIVALRATGTWKPALWARLARYIPFYGVLAWTSISSRNRSRPPRHHD